MLVFKTWRLVVFPGMLFCYLTTMCHAQEVSWRFNITPTGFVRTLHYYGKNSEQYTVFTAVSPSRQDSLGSVGEEMHIEVIAAEEEILNWRSLFHHSSWKKHEGVFTNSAEYTGYVLQIRSAQEEAYIAFLNHSYYFLDIRPLATYQTP
jgi:hypothetical protein